MILFTLNFHGNSRFVLLKATSFLFGIREDDRKNLISPTLLQTHILKAETMVFQNEHIVTILVHSLCFYLNIA
jgi:hypothetical protein